MLWVMVVEQKVRNQVIVWGLTIEANLLIDKNILAETGLDMIFVD